LDNTKFLRRRSRRMGFSFWNRGQSMLHDAAFLARFTDLPWNNLDGCSPAVASVVEIISIPSALGQ
jgi:hypothetical protein